VADLAKRAGASVGAFYGRFEGKAALLESLDERVFDQGRANWTERLSSETNRGRSRDEVLRAVVSDVVGMRRRHKGLLRSLALYVRSGAAPAGFLARARTLNRFVARRLLELLQEAPRKVDHPAPLGAVNLVLRILDSTTRDAILFEDLGLFPALSDRELIESLLPTLTICLDGPGRRGSHD